MDNNFMRPIAHFERKYLVTRDGRVWNQGKERWQRISQLDNGYLKVDLKLNGEYQQALVHRLVALHFIPNPYEHPLVNHKDGVKSHNYENNLEWSNHVGNAQHALENGLRAGFMSFAEKRLLVGRVLAGEKIRDLADEIGRGEQSLSGMLRRMADQDGLGLRWREEMQRRRKDVAVRNLAAINT